MIYNYSREIKAVNICNKPCINGGVCINNAGMQYCRCPSGYTGEFCQTGKSSSFKK